MVQVLSEPGLPKQPGSSESGNALAGAYPSGARLSARSLCSVTHHLITSLL